MDTEFYMPSKAEYGCPLLPISIGMITEEGDDSYAANFREALHEEYMSRVLSREWIKTNVWNKLLPPQDPVWKDFKTISEEVKNFVERNSAERINIWVKGNSGTDNVIFVSLFGRYRNMIDTLCVDGVRMIDIRNSEAVRKRFRNFLNRDEIEAIHPMDENLRHTALYDAWHDKEVFTTIKAAATPKRLLGFELGA